MTLIATEAPLTDVLDAWSRAGKTRFVGADSLDGQPVTLYLVDVAEADDEAGRFFIWEIYTDDDAFKHHGQQPYLAEFREAAGPMTLSREIAMARLITEG